MIKLSELENNSKVIDENLNVYEVEDIKNDLKYFKDKEKKLFTTREYHANIDAGDMLNNAIEELYENEMYKDWNEAIKADITEEDIEKIQKVLDDIFSRAEEQNISYYQDKEVMIDI